MIKIIGIGAGGHSKVVIEILKLTNKYEIVGLLDPKKELWGKLILRVPVIGDASRIEELRNSGISHAFIGIGGANNVQNRKRLFKKTLNDGFEVISVIHPQAVISGSAELGEGLAVMARAIINAEAKIGNNVIVNTGAIVEHECIIGNHVHIATGAKLAGSVTVENATLIGIGATIRQGVRIGKNVIVGAGAVVVNDVPDNVVVVGVPARILRKSDT